MFRNRSGSIGIGTKSDPTKFGTHWKSISHMGLVPNCPKTPKLVPIFGTTLGRSNNASKIGPNMLYFGSISYTYVVFRSRASMGPKTCSRFL